MEHITLKLLSIEIPTGGRVNKIVTADSKRSLIRITNKNTNFF